jgi:hypothetical protein
MRLRTLCILLLALQASVVLAAEPAGGANRVKAFATLPHWPGIWEIDNGVKRGLSGRTPGGAAQIKAQSQLAAHPPYNAEWDARYRADVANTAALAAYAASSKSCSSGFPVVMESPRIFQVVITPEETLIVFDNQEVRHIYTDGRPHPPEDVLWPTRMGDSIGRWEGDTLVVDTVARLAGPIGYVAPMARLSEQARFTERIRMVSPNQLVDEMIIEDPVAFTRPWRVTLRYRRVSELDRLWPSDCYENDRNPVVDGKLTIAPP